MKSIGENTLSGSKDVVLVPIIKQTNMLVVFLKFLINYAAFNKDGKALQYVVLYSEILCANDSDVYRPYYGN